MGGLDDLWEQYLQYLVYGCHLDRFKKYRRLFGILHNIEFTYILDRDENREEDAYSLRKRHCVIGYTRDIEKAFYKREASVFEVLLALAIRVDDEYIGDPSNPHPEDFFMEMIENLGLKECVGNRYPREFVVKKIEKWLDREFDLYGVGSPFPVVYDMRDQRELEIWDQMNSYIYENYGG